MDKSPAGVPHYFVIVHVLGRVFRRRIWIWIGLAGAGAFGAFHGVRAVLTAQHPSPYNYSAADDFFDVPADLPAEWAEFNPPAPELCEQVQALKLEWDRVKPAWDGVAWNGDSRFLETSGLYKTLNRPDRLTDSDYAQLVPIFERYTTITQMLSSTASRGDYDLRVLDAPLIPQYCEYGILEAVSTELLADAQVQLHDGNSTGALSSILNLAAIYRAGEPAFWYVHTNQRTGVARLVSAMHAFA